MAEYSGRCSRCGRVYYEDRKVPVVCDCWKRCPVCSEEMTPYTPDLAANTYGLNGRRDLLVLMVCTLHSPPFFSNQKPVEVEMS